MATGAASMDAADVMARQKFRGLLDQRLASQAGAALAKRAPGFGRTPCGVSATYLVGLYGPGLDTTAIFWVVGCLFSASRDRFSPYYFL